MNAVTARAHSFLDRLEEIFMAVALAFMTILTFVQVILRYIFDTGFVWSLEATTYTFAWMVLIGMSYCVRERAHIAVDLVVDRLPAAARRSVALAAIGLCVAYCGFMIYGGAIFVDALMTLGNNARDVPLPRWLLTSILPIGFALLALRFLQVGWTLLTDKTAASGFGERETGRAVRGN
ncbi:MAG TPA: TRAP transporter small permease [Gammaproteobacteria bacterium]|nr:TRAP transporter small permease [Gammaproteobacteria bacterium]